MVIPHSVHLMNALRIGHNVTSNQFSNSSSSSLASHSLSYLLHCFEEDDKNDANANADDNALNEIHDLKSISNVFVRTHEEEKISFTLRNLNVDKFRNVHFRNVVKDFNVFRSLKPNKPILNLNVMLILQKLGYNAAICKSKWDNCGGLIISGSYNFIDVIRSGVPYFIDLNFAGEFEIARQTNEYQRISSKLLDVFVGRSVDLKLTVKLINNEIRWSIRWSVKKLSHEEELEVFVDFVKDA